MDFKNEMWLRDFGWVRVSKYSDDAFVRFYGKEFPSRMGRNLAVIILFREKSCIAYLFTSTKENLNFMNMEEAKYFFGAGMPIRNSHRTKGCSFYDLVRNKKINLYGLLKDIFSPEILDTIIFEVESISNKFFNHE